MIPNENEKIKKLNKLNLQTVKQNRKISFEIIAG